jgi:hypothetical protein
MCWATSVFFKYGFRVWVSSGMIAYSVRFLLPNLLQGLVICYWYVLTLGECGECVSRRYLTMVSVKMYMVRCICMN